MPEKRIITDHLNTLTFIEIGLQRLTYRTLEMPLHWISKSWKFSNWTKNRL